MKLPSKRPRSRGRRHYGHGKELCHTLFVFVCCKVQTYLKVSQNLWPCCKQVQICTIEDAIDCYDSYTTMKAFLPWQPYYLDRVIALTDWLAWQIDSLDSLTALTDWLHWQIDCIGSLTAWTDLLPWLLDCYESLTALTSFTTLTALLLWYLTAMTAWLLRQLDC